MFTLTAALRRYAGLVLAITATATAAGVLAARLSQPQYEARARVSLGPDPETERLPHVGPPSRHGRVDSSLSHVVLDSIVAVLNRNVEIQAHESGQFLSLSLVGSDPERTAEVLNDVVEQLVEEAARLKRAKLQELEEVLAEQLEIARRQLERALGYPEPRWPPHLENRTFSAYVRLRVALDSVVRSREALALALAGASDSPSGADALQAIPAVQQRAPLAEALRRLRENGQELHRLRARYKNEDARLVRLQREIAALEEDIRGLAVALVAELEARESELQRAVAAVASRIASIPPRRIQERAHERRWRSAERFYEELRERDRQTLQAFARRMPDLRVLEPAIPPREPVGRQGQLQLVLAVLLISLAVGVLDAILLYWLDRRLEQFREWV